MARVPIYSPLTGSVAVLLAEDGALIAEDEPIMELEAFKMITGINAPVAGKIYYRVALGEVVGEDDVLAVIETL